MARAFGLNGDSLLVTCKAYAYNGFDSVATGNTLILNIKTNSVGQITGAFRDFLEKIIREEPHNYLWTHRRWKWDYKDEYADNWIDKARA
jgi:hypothetical protein